MSEAIEEHTRVRGIDGLITYVPFSLGFRPDDSVVVVGLKNSMVVVCARADRPEPVDLPDCIAAVVDGCWRAIDTVIVLYWDADAFEVHGSAARLQCLEGFGAAFEARGVSVAELVLTDGNCWATTDDRTQRPVATLESVPAVAEAIWRGRAPAAGRDDVAQQVRAGVDEMTQPIAELMAGLGSPTPEAAVHAARAVLGSDEATPRQHAVLLRALQNVAFRDALLEQLGPGLPGTSPPDPLNRQFERAFGDLDSTRLQERLVRLCRCCPVAESAPALTVLAVIAWAGTCGVVATEACHEALAVDPDYRLARLIQLAIQHGVRPVSPGETGHGGFH